MDTAVNATNLPPLLETQYNETHIPTPRKRDKEEVIMHLGEGEFPKTSYKEWLTKTRKCRPHTRELPRANTHPWIPAKDRVIKDHGTQPYHLHGGGGQARRKLRNVLLQQENFFTLKNGLDGLKFFFSKPRRSLCNLNQSTQTDRNKTLTIKPKSWGLIFGQIILLVCGKGGEMVQAPGRNSHRFV